MFRSVAHCQGLRLGWWVHGVRIGTYRIFHIWPDRVLIGSQLLNILFALCGITGALYGMGQRSKLLLGRGTMETAMFVCAIPIHLQYTRMKSHANVIQVVVARSNELCLDVRTCKDLHRIGPSPLDDRQGPSTHSIHSHWRYMCHWPCVLVHVDASVPTGFFLLATYSASVG